jgi:hypothetical protein
MTLGRRRTAALLASPLSGLLLAACSGVTTDRSQKVPVDPPESSSELPGTPSTGSPESFVATRPRTSAELTGQLIAVERLIADPKTRPAVLRRAALSQQLIYRVLGGTPEWDDKVFRHLPPDVRDVARAHVAARREFRSMHPHSTLGDTLPAWRIVAPAPAGDLLRFYRQAEARYDVGWEYLAAINLVETAMGRIRGTSTAGAQGPMQFLPSTWAAFGRGDINNRADAIMAAARYLAHNGFASPGGRPGALYRYNNSDAYVRGVTGYARLLEKHPRTFLAVYQWQVYYVTTEGDVLLPVGYERRRPVPVKQYLATHPQA